MANPWSGWGMIKHYTVITLNTLPSSLGKRISEAHYAALRDAQANLDKPEEGQEIDSEGIDRDQHAEGRESA